MVVLMTCLLLGCLYCLVSAYYVRSAALSMLADLRGSYNHCEYFKGRLRIALTDLQSRVAALDALSS